ncbi:thiolase family protein [Brevibacillus marinus]|uniref:thiolase family protein n=1 Tax=Brevibacillus marinus TaxID=2496837 RepID=UPI000F826BBD|nr:thiolase family protein [Brevibacillus marinus]
MVVIVNALRTPIGKYAGTLSNKTPEELAKTVMGNNLAHAGLSPEQVDEVILGQTKQSAHAPNIARVASLLANFPEELSAYTVHRQCGSGMQAVHNAYMSIIARQAEIVLAGGVESMSQAPYYMIVDRNGFKPGNLTLYDSNVESQPKSQPERKYGSFNMGETAEHLAEKYGISRSEQDEFALHSQLKAKRAIANGVFQDEIVPVEIDSLKHGTRIFSQDEQPRETSLEELAKLNPVFKQGGTVTAGNSSGRSDGAAVLLLMKEERALAMGYTPLARIRGIGAAGVSPKEMGIGPVPATQKALKMAGLELKDMDLIELNEAFAAQSLAVLREWGIGQERVNVNGGAIALGHPLGCSGARILVTLVHEMQKRDVRYGLATLCTAGGQGVATIVEKWQE